LVPLCLRCARSEVGGRALRGGIPRAFRSHKSSEGETYGDYCRAILDRIGVLPRCALPTLKAAGHLVVELDRLTDDLDAARRGRRRRDQNRIRRQMVVARTQLMAVERRLEEIAADGHGPGADDPLAAIKRAVESANQL
jgi:hypothetical protein